MSLQCRQLPDSNGKPPDRKSKHDDRRPSPHPRKKCTLICEVIARSVGIEILRHFRPTALFHSLPNHNAGAHKIPDQLLRHAMLAKYSGSLKVTPKRFLRHPRNERLQRRKSIARLELPHQCPTLRIPKD
jgi:hypothetical protein